MTVQKFRSIAEMHAAQVSRRAGDGQASFDRFARHCERYWSISPRVFPRGVFKFRTVEDAQAARPRPDVRPTVPPEWLEDFEAAARRPLETRFRYAFIRTYKPVLDDAPYRAFETMAAYRRWCEESLPAWLGYGRV